MWGGSHIICLNTARLLVLPPCQVYIYTAATSAAAFVDACKLPGATPMMAGILDATTAVTLPFNFSLYASTAATAAWISPKGVLGINSAATTEWRNVRLPSAATPVRNAVFGEFFNGASRCSSCSR
jgi:hypothetical protein